MAARDGRSHHRRRNDDGTDEGDTAMTTPLTIHVNDTEAAARADGKLTLGARFLFLHDGALLDDGRRGRLQAWRSNARRVVKAVVGDDVVVSGVRVSTQAAQPPRACALVADRDLYRTDTDTARLVCVLPRLEGGERASLKLSLDGQLITTRDVTSAPGGLVVEAFGALVAGRYTAELVIDDDVVAGPVEFTVADYTLPPLSVRVVARTLSGDQLSLQLAVESWQVPCHERLKVSLLEGTRLVETKSCAPEGGGRYAVDFVLHTTGALRVRVAVEDDPARTAEAALPGARKSEREQVVVSELGTEVRLSLLPGPRSLAVRGAFLERGDSIATPLVVDDVVTRTPTLRVVEAVEGLVVAWWLPNAGRWEVEELGDFAAGARVTLSPKEPLAVATVGCFVQGGPFEALTTFFRPDDAEDLVVEHPAVVRPRGTLPVTLKTTQKQRVLLAIKDERLTSTDTPQVALQAKLKAGVTTIASVLGDDFRYEKVEVTSSVAARVEAGAKLEVIVRETGKPPKRLTFASDEVTFGRVAGNEVVLPAGNISKRHARVVLRDGKVIVVDLKTTNGTFVNGERISSPRVLNDLDTVGIGPFVIEVRVLGATGAHDRFWVDGAVGAGPPRGVVPRSFAPAFSNVRNEAPAMRSAPPPQARAQAASPPMARSAAPMVRDELARGAPAPRSPAASPPTAPSDLEFDDLSDGDDALAFSRSPVTNAGARAADDDDFDIATDAGLPEAMVFSEPEGAAAAPRAAQSPARARGAKGDADDERPRESFPEILYFGVVEVDGEATVEIAAGESLAAFSVLAFTLVDGAPTQRETRVQVDQPVRADLDLPLEIADGDVAFASLRVASSSPRALVTLSRDGVDVPLTLDGGEVGGSAAGLEVSSGARLRFAVAAGRWRARVEDLQTGETDAVDVVVGKPGAFTRITRELVFLSEGRTLTLDDDGALTMRVVPGLDAPLRALCHATVDYNHACCEQTAAKLVGAATMWLTSTSIADRDLAVRAIVAGVDREKRMHVRGRGFRMYPDMSGISDHYTPMVVEHLWRLRRLADVRDLPTPARRALGEALAMADDVGGALGMRYVPQTIKNAHDAWAVAARAPERIKESLEWVGKAIAVDDNGPRSKLNGAVRGNVLLRSLFAYGAAVAMLGKKPATALKLAGEVVRTLNDDGGLYSTLDNVAAIAMMTELARAGALSGSARADVNGTSMSSLEAAVLGDTVEAVTATSGVVAVEVTRLREELITAERANCPVRVTLHGEGMSAPSFLRGRVVDVVVALPEGYREGDLVQISLPPCLAWLSGGGRVKRFTVDFQGRSEVRIRLAVIDDLPGRQSLFVVVRNMFEEERVGAPGPIPLVPGTPPSSTQGTQQKRAGVLERLLGRKA
jgi:hypothetical protein